MISAFRSYLNTWVVRGFFLILVAAFAVWGIGDVIRNMGSQTWVAKIGDRTIEPAELQEALRVAVARYTRSQGSDPSPEVRRALAEQALQAIILRAAVDQEVARLRVVVPDAELRESVFAIPAFHGPNGQFDRQVFETLLRNNNLTEARFLELQRADMARRQVLEPVRAGAAAPDLLVQRAFAYRGEKRFADMVSFPFATVSPPQAPDEAALKRWYDNHPWMFSSPEYRRIKAVILSPETVSKGLEIPEAELRKAYQEHSDEFVTPPKRSVEVILAADEAKAKALAEKWRGGADWAAMQAAAKADGATAVQLDNASETELPVSELAKAVFAAAPDAVTGPVKSPLGWHVFRVTAATPGSTQTFDQVKDRIRDRLLADRAGDLVYDRANKLDNLLGTGASLDEIPADLGAAAVAGTLDAKGNTLDGAPAPIPGGEALRKAVIEAAFQAHVGDPPHLTEVRPPEGGAGASSYYALSLEAVLPPKVKPFDEVRAQVLADWKQNEVRHAQDAASAALLTAVNGGKSLADAAAAIGATVRRSPAIERDTPAEGVPPLLQRVIFGMKVGEATQVETPDGFVVAVLAEIKPPDPAQDAAMLNAMRTQLDRQTGDDVEELFADALRARAGVQVNQTVLNEVAQP
ncbi:MAG: peptidyl-prolyl cis-trans isomerase [Proteobacteria bacterium]|nr:peptidyl-prolyl cis-trans isomerase [Pseudomonadota bacterium]